MHSYILTFLRFYLCLNRQLAGRYDMRRQLDCYVVFVSLFGNSYRGCVSSTLLSSVIQELLCCIVMIETRTDTHVVCSSGPWECHYCSAVIQLLLNVLVLILIVFPEVRAVIAKERGTTQH